MHLVVPVVGVVASRTRVGLGFPVTLTCFVIVGNPTNYTYSWSHKGTPLTGETSDTLSLPFFGEDDVGIYSCEVANEVGAGMDNVTIELGCEKLLLL